MRMALGGVGRDGFGQDRFGHDGLGHDRLGHDGVGGHVGLDRFGWVVLVCIWTFGPQ